MTDEQAHLLATARSVALACVDASDEAREVIASVADVVPPGEAREPLRAAVLDALARHADRQHALLPLLEALA